MLIRLMTNCYILISKYLSSSTIYSNNHEVNTQRYDNMSMNDDTLEYKYTSKPIYTSKIKKGYPYICGYCLQQITLSMHRYDDRSYCSVTCREKQICREMKNKY